MARWNKTKKENCEDILNNTISNLHHATYDAVLQKVLDSDTTNNKQQIEKFVRNELKITTNASARTIEYWKQRGWSEDISYVKAKESRVLHKSVSVFSREYWCNKINPETGVNYTIAEADFQRNSRRPTHQEYWISKGFTIDQALLLARSTKDSNNKKGAIATKTSKVRRVTSKRCVEYFIARGYSTEEAKKLVSQSQLHFSKKICIEKYGELIGLRVWQARQLKWKQSLKDTGMYLGISKSSLRLFNEVQKYIPTIMYGKDEQSVTVADHIIWVDCLAPDKKIIEFYGDYWHANPKKFKADDVIKTKLASEIWINDAARINLLISAGYTVLVIWESELKKFEETIKKCIEFLKK